MSEPVTYMRIPNGDDYFDQGCRECGRDNRNGTHSALERTGHLSHSWNPIARQPVEGGGER